MRKLMALLLVMCTLLPTALAETVIDPLAERGIHPAEVGLNEVPEGVSPTTGRRLGTVIAPNPAFAGLAVTGRYLPMLVQIGNDGGGIGDRAPWGITYADVIYEMPLIRDQETRMTAVFSDLIPDSVGFVRSARVGHVWLREEWDGGFLYYGQQEVKGTNVKEAFRTLGANEKGVLFSGTAGGTAWKQYYTSRKRLRSPYDMDANVAAMSRMVPESHIAPNHAYLFTDEAPEGDTGKYVYIDWGASASAIEERFVYRSNWGGYIRNAGPDHSLWYADRDADADAIAFQNIIIQFVKVEYRHNSKLEPVVYVIGADGAPAEGNADFFMCGKHVSGYWKRDSMTSRTVFYGPDGLEMPMQRGRTMIIIFPDDGSGGKSVSYK